MRKTALNVLLSIAFAASAAGADPTGFVQVLVPFDTVTFTSHPSRWSAELRVLNLSDTPVNLFPVQCSWLGRPEPCTKRIDVPARTSMVLDVLPYASFNSPGVFLYVPVDRQGDVQFDLRVRARSRGERLGTSVPVVRSSSYRTGRTIIINVPVGPTLRPSLRIYHPNLFVYVVAFRIQVLAEPTGELLVDKRYVRGLPTDPPSPALVPATFTFSDALVEAAAIRSGLESVSVVIEHDFQSQTPYWPMISVTDADDNVIVLTPNG